MKMIDTVDSFMSNSALNFVQLNNRNFTAWSGRGHSVRTTHSIGIGTLGHMVVLFVLLIHAIVVLALDSLSGVQARALKFNFRS